MGMIHDACSDSICETMEKNLDSRVYTDKHNEDIHIKVRPHGDYLSEDKDKLLQVLNDAAWSVMKCETVVYKQRGGCAGATMPIVCQDPPDQTHIICEVPQFWAVQKGDNNGGVQVEITSEADTSNKDWCENLMGVGSSVAGKSLRFRTLRVMLIISRLHQRERRHWI